MTMTKEEMNVFLNEEYAEAIRYMENAKETLNKAGKDDRHKHYKDRKYVRSACGIAYLGVLVAMEAWLTMRGINMPDPKKQNRSIDIYKSYVSKLDGAMMSDLNSAYNVLHLQGYYRYETSIKIIKDGFDTAYDIIDRIKPDTVTEVRDTKIDALKRALNVFLMSVGLI